MALKNLKLYSIALAAGFALIVTSCSKEDPTSASDSSQSTLKAGNSPSASGQGTFTYNGNVRHFSFHANTMPGGNVQGSGVLSYNSNVIKIKFNINCLMIVGNAATMSGAVTSSTSPDWPAGTPVAFQVVDNGEGSSNPADQITLLQQSPYWDCTTWPGLPLNDITGGNVQVKP